MATVKPKFNPRVLDRIQFEHGVRSERALAKLIGVNTSTLHRWRSGEGGPTWESTARIIKLGIRPDEMILNHVDEYELAAQAA